MDEVTLGEATGAAEIAEVILETHIDRKEAFNMEEAKDADIEGNLPVSDAEPVKSDVLDDADDNVVADLEASIAMEPKLEKILESSEIQNNGESFGQESEDTEGCSSTELQTEITSRGSKVNSTENLKKSSDDIRVKSSEDIRMEKSNTDISIKKSNENIHMKRSADDIRTQSSAKKSNEDARAKSYEDMRSVADVLVKKSNGDLSTKSYQEVSMKKSIEDVNAKSSDGVRLKKSNDDVRLMNHSSDDLKRSNDVCVKQNCDNIEVTIDVHAPENSEKWNVTQNNSNAAEISVIPPDSDQETFESAKSGLEDESGYVNESLVVNDSLRVNTSLLRKPGTESHDNPFTADGELSKKAEYIIRHSTISRSEIRISDPDLHKAKVKEEAIRTEVATSNAAPPPNDRENGKVEVSPKEVEVEVAAANASQPQPQQAEQVKVKGSKCKCCVVM